jgi:RimJ/RimL family protein N-acetyltransferase
MTEPGRIHLRAWQDSDAEFIYDMYGRWEVQRFLGASPRVMESRDEALEAIARWRARAEPPYGVRAITRADGQPVGSVLLKPLPLSGPELVPSDDIEIGWHLHPDHWGHGYATEAAAVVLAEGFAYGLPEVNAVTYRENVASQAVCRRLGMEHRGTTDRYYNISCELFTVRNPVG